MRGLLLAIGLLLPVLGWAAEPLGIDLEGYPYPFPVAFLPLSADGHRQWAHGLAVARAQLPRELLGQGDPSAHRRRVPGDCAGPDRLRQILQTRGRMVIR